MQYCFDAHNQSFALLSPRWLTFYVSAFYAEFFLWMVPFRIQQSKSFKIAFVLLFFFHLVTVSLCKSISVCNYHCWKRDLNCLIMLLDQTCHIKSSSAVPNDQNAMSDELKRSSAAVDIGTVHKMRVYMKGVRVFSLKDKVLVCSPFAVLSVYSRN